MNNLLRGSLEMTADHLSKCSMQICYCSLGQGLWM